MSIKNIIDESYEPNLGVPAPVITNITVQTTNTVAPINIPLTFIKTGNLCSMTMGSWSGSGNYSMVNIDMSNPALAPFKPSGELRARIMANIGYKVWAVFYWNPSTNLANISQSVVPPSGDWSVDNAQTINYNLV